MAAAAHVSTIDRVAPTGPPSGIETRPRLAAHKPPASGGHKQSTSTVHKRITSNNKRNQLVKTLFARPLADSRQSRHLRLLPQS
jgi:hypothetical protein